MVFDIGLLLTLCILILFTKLFVLMLQGWSYVFLCDFVQMCGPMKQTCALPTLHWNWWVPTTINLSHGNPIGLGIVCHKPCEFHMHDTILQHDNITVFPKQCLGHSILWLHITTNYYENLAMLAIVDIISQCCPILKTFDMVKHDPRIFHVSSTLHMLH